ncbi:MULTISPECIES: DJ-1/PfpI family protein [Pseudonocardia]|uniref:Isonitrile hydratase n=2 Tax=Pseudonocardia TaxID=1847 RepID=A0A1Y2MJY6_PSEAH|nr:MULTISPECIES: DJ-1/PfpI family protein [Pseudonocardia]OSY35596.1 Isonitrile hydratase [Pseudonocardia autotrophica]TDN76887.1 DJ-1/PfpI family protein [Pseudonocardia autotrophica]BBG00890.1 glutamine amidotransferase [Pseudonocardia autotrophica]GEC27551.1 glutamine amidotransferase [Pseudonocardia saturnea]
MQIAIVLYPDFTALDVVGPYEVLGRLPGAEVVFVAEDPGLVRNDQRSLVVSPEATLDEVTNPDIVLVGGGPGSRLQLDDGKLHEWLRAVDRTSTWTTSVCTGAPILAAAGLLRGRRATTHWAAMEVLARFGAIPVHDRVVVDGHYVSGAGVSAGIDMSLMLAGRIAGDDVAQMVQLIIEYAPEPPYAAGSLDVAPESVVERARAALAR